MKKSTLSSISIALSVVCFIVIIKINHDLAVRYLSSDGKTQALFGLIETTNFIYKYYFISISMISITLAILATVKKEKKTTNWIAYILAISSLIMIFLQLWRTMI